MSAAIHTPTARYTTAPATHPGEAQSGRKPATIMITGVHSHAAYRMLNQLSRMDSVVAARMAPRKQHGMTRPHDYRVTGYGSPAHCGATARPLHTTTPKTGSAWVPSGRVLVGMRRASSRT